MEASAGPADEHAGIGASTQTGGGGGGHEERVVEAISKIASDVRANGRMAMWQPAGNMLHIFAQCGVFDMLSVDIDDDNVARGALSMAEAFPLEALISASAALAHPLGRAMVLPATARYVVRTRGVVRDRADWAHALMTAAACIAGLCDGATYGMAAAVGPCNGGSGMGQQSPWARVRPLRHERLLCGVMTSKEYDIILASGGGSSTRRSDSTSWVPVVDHEVKTCVKSMDDEDDEDEDDDVDALQQYDADEDGPFGVTEKGGNRDVGTALREFRECDSESAAAIWRSAWVVESSGAGVGPVDIMPRDGLEMPLFVARAVRAALRRLCAGVESGKCNNGSVWVPLVIDAVRPRISGILGVCDAVGGKRARAGETWARFFAYALGTLTKFKNATDLAVWTVLQKSVAHVVEARPHCVAIGGRSFAWLLGRRMCRARMEDDSHSGGWCNGVCACATGLISACESVTPIVAAASATAFVHGAISASGSPLGVFRKLHDAIEDCRAEDRCAQRTIKTVATWTPLAKCAMARFVECASDVDCCACKSRWDMTPAAHRRQSLCKCGCMLKRGNPHNPDKCVVVCPDAADFDWVEMCAGKRPSCADIKAMIDAGHTDCVVATLRTPDSVVAHNLLHVLCNACDPRIVEWIHASGVRHDKLVAAGAPERFVVDHATFATYAKLYAAREAEEDAVANTPAAKRRAKKWTKISTDPDAVQGAQEARARWTRQATIAKHLESALAHVVVRGTRETGVAVVDFAIRIGVHMCKSSVLMHLADYASTADTLLNFPTMCTGGATDEVFAAVLDIPGFVSGRGRHAVAFVCDGRNPTPKPKPQSKSGEAPQDLDGHASHRTTSAPHKRSLSNDSERATPKKHRA